MNTYWFIAFIVWSLLLTFGGYEFKGFEDKAIQTSAQEASAKELGQGEAKIITDNQVLEKMLNDDKDPCLHDKLPGGIK